MKVILQQDVKGQGKKGQMVEVSDGYARNFLLPRKLAVSATADNINTMKQHKYSSGNPWFLADSRELSRSRIRK